MIENVLTLAGLAVPLAFAAVTMRRMSAMRRVPVRIARRRRP